MADSLQKGVDIRPPPSVKSGDTFWMFLDVFASKGKWEVKMMNLQKTIYCLFYMQSGILKRIRSVKLEKSQFNRIGTIKKKKNTSNRKKTISSRAYNVSVNIQIHDCKVVHFFPSFPKHMLKAYFNSSVDTLQLCKVVQIILLMLYRTDSS